MSAPPREQPERPPTAWKKTVRFRLTMGFIGVILLANATVSVVTVLHVNKVLLREVQTRVTLDLNSARTIYNAHLQEIASFLHAISLKRSLAAPLGKGELEEVGGLLQTIRREGRMDMLSLVDMDGRVIYRARNPGLSGDDLSDNPIVASVLKTRRPASGTILVPHEELLREGSDLAARAFFQIRPTKAAAPSKKKTSTDGMLLAAAYPILDGQGEIVRLLYGADLLNRDFEIVDSIKHEVFQQQTWEDKDIGTATIFQRDLRISTNVLAGDGERAIGTRLSAEVAREVLEQGKVWNSRAFVVTDWYITAYEPIRDPADRIVGVLYVGLLEAPFTHTQKVTLGVFLAAMLATTTASLVLLFLVTNLTLRPIGRILSMSRKVVAGDLGARVKIRPPGEMGVLCEAIDRMAEAISERQRQLELATRQQIGRSEQLASIGRLAAGIAHEINNPLTGVLTFAHLLREKEEMDAQSREDLDVILRETTRVREIVRGLLDFARESPSVKQPLDVNQVIQQTMRLVRSQKEFRRVTVVEQPAADLPRVLGDKNQLQQVFLNLSLNACEAMQDGGTLTITTSAVEDRVRIAVADTGCGIKKEHLDQVFEPFFTTKPVGKGTGLGLSVSYGIVQQHQGTFEVHSEEGQGATFVIELPVAPEGGAAVVAAEGLGRSGSGGRSKQP